MNILYILDLIGTAAFAASGAWVGVRKHMDLFGVLVLGMVTAVGGGTLRDLLLGDIPPFSLKRRILHLYCHCRLAGGLRQPPPVRDVREAAALF